MKNNKTEKLISLNIDKSSNLKLRSISYSMYKSLQCPIKYYFQYIVKEETVSYYIVKGIVVHTLYEKALSNLKKDLTQVEQFDNLTDNEIRKEVEDYITKKNIYISEENLTKLIKDIRTNLKNSFLVKISSRLRNGWLLYIEQPNKAKEIVSVINANVDLYTKSDIILIKQDKVEIIDIKTGKIIPQYMEQLVFYLYSFIEYAGQHKYYIGSIYSTKFNRYKILLYTHKNYVIDKFHKYIESINSLYRNLNINNINDLRNFVEIYLTTAELNEQQRTLITETNDCCYCKYKNICPILDPSERITFKDYINNKPLSEKKIILEIPPEKLSIEEFNKEG